MILMSWEAECLCTVRQFVLQILALDVVPDLEF